MKKHTSLSCVLDGLVLPSLSKTSEFSHSKTSISRGFQRFALLLFFSVAMINAYAVTITVSSTTESRCLSNGTITVAASAGTAPYQYRILSGPGYPTPSVYQASATFSNLAPGTYSVEVKDATTATNNVSATVAGTYTTPTFVIDSVRDEACPCTGAIFARVSAGGRAPFAYRMRKTGTATWGANQASSTFNNVCTGNYDVQVEDSCGNLQTINNLAVGVQGGPFEFDIPQAGMTNNNVFPWVQRQNCGTGVIGFAFSYYGSGSYCSMHYVSVPNAGYTSAVAITNYADTSYNMLRVKGGTPPYIYTLTGTNGYTATQTGSSKFKDVPMNGVYTLQVTDACGRSFKAAITADPLSLNKKRHFMSSDCINNSYSLNSNAGCAGGYEGAGGAHYRQDTNSYRDWIKPTGNLTYYAQGGEPAGTLKPYRSNSTPGDSLYMWQYNGTYPISYQVVSGPGAPFPAVIRTAEGLGNGGYTPLVLNNVDPTATYIVKITDACGQVIYDTVKNTTNDTLKYANLVWDGQNACPGYMAKRFDVGAEQAIVTSVSSVPAGGVVTFGDLTTPLLGARVSSGTSYYFKKGFTYTIEWTGVCTGTKLTKTYDYTALDTVTITTVQNPPCVAGTSTGSIVAKFDAVNFSLLNYALLFQGDYNPNWTYADKYQQSTNGFNTGGSVTFTSLPAGKYTIMFLSYTGNTVLHCMPYKTVILDAYQALKTEVEPGAICSPATTAQIATINTSLGKPSYKYQIKLSSDPPSSYSAVQYSSVFVKPAGAYDIRVVDSCSNSVTVSATLGPLAPPSLTSNLTTCANSSIVITANKIRNMRYKWYKQGTVVAGQTTNVFTYPNATLADAGTYRCEITDTVGSCGSLFTDITISIVADPNPATINLPSALCSDDTLKLIGGSTNAPAPTTGNWTFVSGPTGANPTIASFTSPTTTAYPTPANKLTPYIFRWTYNNGTCSSNKTDTVKILPMPTIVPGSNILSCEATSETLTEKTLSSGYTGRWSQVSGPTVTITDRTNPQSTVTGLTFPNTYKFRWTVYNIEDTTSCSTIHDITLTNSQMPSLAKAGSDTLLCGGSDVYTMKATAPTVGTGRWTVLSWPSSTSTPQISINAPISNVTLPAAGTYVFEWQTFNGGSCPVSRDTVVINRVVAKAGPDVNVCTSPAVAAKMKAVKLTPGFTGTWSVAANSPKPGPLTFIPNVNSDTAQVFGYTAGKYYLVWTVSSGACTATDTAILTANIQPTKPSAGADQLGLCANSTILSGTLGHARDSSAFKFWSKLSGPAVSFSKYDSLTNTIGLFAEGTYNVQLEIVQPGCLSVYDTMVITKTGTPPNVKVDSFKNPTCAGLSNGIIYVSSTPTINQTHEYRINGGTWQSSKIFTGLAAGTYTVDVRNALAINCVNTAPAPITLIPANSSPVANAGRDTSVCAGKLAQLGVASVTGNTYLWAASLGLSSTTISNPTFSSTTSNVYTRTLEVTTTATGCKGYDTVVITVNPLPVVSITSSNAAMCQGQTRTLSGLPTGGTFIGTGVVGTTFTAPTTAGSYTIKYAVTNATGCSDTATQVIVVNPKVTLGAITFSPTAVCVGSTTTASSSPTGGTWSIVSGPATINASSGVLTATGSTLVTVRYVHPGVSGTSCPDTVSATITPTAVPVANITSSTAAMCINTTRALTGTPAGGTFSIVSGSGSIAGTTLTATAAGTISLKYSVTSSGCIDDTIVNITVNALPTVSITSSSASMCPTETRTLAGSPAGGTFSGTGVSGTTFTAPATAGNYTITYSYTDANTCSNTATQTITVNPKVTLGAITFSPTAVCVGSTTTATATPTGGSWSIVSGPATINASSGVLTATGSTLVTVRYVHPGVSGTSCPDTVSATITPTALPVANITSSTAAMCINTTRALTGTPAGGTFSIVSGGGSLSGTTLTATTAGTISLKYSVTSSGCSDDTIVNITVNALPIVSITSTNSSMCPTDTRTLAGSPAGGTFSGTGVSGTTFTAPATAGNYTITYSYTDANTCSNTTTQTITVNPPVTLGAITFSPATVCSAGGTTTASGSPAGGTWSLVSGSGSVNSSSGIITASGTTAIVVKYSHPGVSGTSCPTTINGTITPTASPVATVTSSTTAMCINSTRTLTGTPAGGTFTVVSGGGSIAGTTLTATAAGTITLKYSATSSGCSDDTIVNITVNALPIVSITSSNANICQGQTRTLVGSPAGGTFSGTGVSGTTFTAPTTAGNYTITYSYTDANTCSNTATQTLTVNPSPVVNAGADDTICFGSSKVLTGSQTTSLTGLTYEWYMQGSTTPIPPTGTTVTVTPTATANYVFIATTGAGCSSSDTMTLGVIQKPDLINDMTTCQTATEDVTATFALSTLTSNDNNTAVIKGGITYTVLTPKHGTASLSGTSITYLANANYNGFDTVQLVGASTLCPSLKDTAIFCINIAAVNDTPKAMNDTATTPMGTAVTKNLLTNDSDVDNTLTGSSITVLTGPTHGSLGTVDAAGNVTYTPNANFVGIDTVMYKVCDAGTPVLCDTAYAYFNVTPNIPDTTTTTAGNTTTPIVVGPTLGTVTTAAVSGPIHGSGTATVDPMTGAVTFTPSSTPFIGKDTLVRIVGVMTTMGMKYDTSLIIINNPSKADTLRATTAMNTPVSFPKLTNYTFQGTPLAPIVDPKLTINADGTVTFTPRPGFVGIDTARIVRCDDKGNCITTVYIVTVTPSYPDTAVATTLGTPISVKTPITLYPGQSQTTTVLNPTDNGTTTINPDGSITYTPNPSFVGRDTIVRQICIYDTATMLTFCDTVTTIFTVLPKNPTTSNATTNENTPVSGGTPITRLPGTSTTITPVGPSNGTATVNPDGTITYTPKPGFVGKDTVKRIVCVYDSISKATICDTTLVIFTVLPVSDDVKVTTTQGNPVKGGDPIASILGTSKTVTPIGPKNGTVSVNPDGTLTYTPNPSFVGNDTVTRIVCILDSATMVTKCDTSVIVFTVLPHTTNPDVNVTNVNQPVSGNLKTNDNVMPGTTYGTPVASTSNPSSSVPTVNPDGTYTFTSSVPGVYTFSIPVCPPGMTTNCPMQTLTITVLDPSKTNPPVANVDVATTNVATSVTLNTLSNDQSGNTNTSLDPSSVTIVSQPKNGTATVNPTTGAITYTPKAGFVGNDTLTYQVCDNGTPKNCATAYQIITVKPASGANTTNAGDDFVTAKANTPISGNVKTNDSDPEGNTQTVVAQTTSIPGKGTLVLNADGTFTFTPVDGFSGPVNFVYSTCDNGTPQACASGTIYILVEAENNFDIPNYFSPNGDGKDDNFVLPAALYAKYPNLKLTIYNRWGNIVWRSTGKYTNDWHAQSLGSELPVPDGVYYYLIELNSEFKETKTGFIEVMRQ